ncbi:MAG TPA: mercuric reductase [Ktedonobacteraceae bacterium]|jgi:pyruvate/2-oxoglutarate dehydrogenase complex dihydrolipoamide dehydrogenase (E3) component|nr:mercuric reductase [Ktedonobacteraceae bacterium]
MATSTYDAIIIGAGQAGGPLSTALAKAGWKTAIIERVHVGGTCINEGCTPTKTMVASARVAYLARRGADYGVHTGPITIDMAKVRQRKRDIVNSFRSGSERRIESTEGVDLLMGEARFSGPKELEVRLGNGELRQLSANTIFINAGDRPAEPDIKGAENVTTLNSTTIMELDTVPEHLLVIGGGYVGLEFGQMFRRFGSAVTIVQRGANLLTREDPDVAEAVANILREDGLGILLQTKPVSVEKTNDGHIALTVQGPDGERVLYGSHLLMAAGRVPNTDWLNLPATGIQVDKRGYIPTSDRLETSVPSIYALGDIKGGPAFTHISYDDFRIIRTNLLEGGNASMRDRLVPYTVFIDPQLGRVGLSETEARASGRNIKVARMPMDYVARALEVDESRGFMKAIVDADNNQILGCAILGIEGGEIMAMLEIAMLGKVPYTTLREAIFAHPTLAESLNNLFGMIE